MNCGRWRVEGDEGRAARESWQEVRAEESVLSG